MLSELIWQYNISFFWILGHVCSENNLERINSGLCSLDLSGIGFGALSRLRFTWILFERSWLGAFGSVFRSDLGENLTFGKLPKIWFKFLLDPSRNWREISTYVFFIFSFPPIFEKFGVKNESLFFKNLRVVPQNINLDLGKFFL